MKRLIKKVELVFFCDDATGDYGLAHKDTYDNTYSGTAFNAFWNGTGIFHDVFEHSHEYSNKYFRGDYAMNVGGEMAAMGAMWYYINTLGVWNRLQSRNYRYSNAELMRLTTQDMIQESIEYGNSQYGSTLESNVPKQRPTNDCDLEDQISQYWHKVKGFSPDTNYEQEREYGIEYKKSVTFRKIADLHRYGYRMAAKMVPDTLENRNTLCDFYSFFEEFCANNDAKELATFFNGMEVKLYKDSEGNITWKAVLIGNGETPNYTLQRGYTHSIIEDIYMSIPE